MKSFTLEELAKLTKTDLIGNPQHKIEGVADLESATSQDAGFLGNLRYLQAMLSSQAGVVFIDRNITPPAHRNFLVSDNPSLSFQQTAELFYALYEETTGFEGIHPTAVIHPTVKLGEGVSIGPNAVIDKEAQIGDRTRIGPGTYIGLGVIIGDDCLLHPNVTVRERCTIGNRVILQPGVVIGSCGFGYTMDKGRHIKLKHIGTVIIEDDVEIGANTTIDRARFKSTMIKQGTKIDNLVQIAHNVVIGEHNILVAQTGIGGSTETGKYVMIGGQAAIDGHLKIGDKAMISARSGVSKSLPNAGKYGGIPAYSLHDYNRNSVYLRNIEKYIKQIKDLEKRIENLEKD